MKSFISENSGRIVTMHLQKGELLAESIRSEAKRRGINNAVLLCAIGSLRKIVMHMILTTDDLAENRYVTIEKPIELGSMQGLILNGEPHFHFVCSSPEGTEYIGHVEDGCEVQYLIELCFMELPGLEVERKLDEYGISYIAERESRVLPGTC